jgi:prevent-host-death family protein
MIQVTIEEAQAKLPELIEKAAPGESLVITRHDRPVAQLIALPMDTPQPVFGSCRGMLTIVADDDEHLADFQEYMP